MMAAAGWRTALALASMLLLLLLLQRVPSSYMCCVCSRGRAARSHSLYVCCL